MHGFVDLGQGSHPRLPAKIKSVATFMVPMKRISSEPQPVSLHSQENFISFADHTGDTGLAIEKQVKQSEMWEQLQSEIWEQRLSTVACTRLYPPKVGLDLLRLHPNSITAVSRTALHHLGWCNAIEMATAKLDLGNGVPHDPDLLIWFLGCVLDVSSCSLYFYPIFKIHMEFYTIPIYSSNDFLKGLRAPHTFGSVEQQARTSWHLVQGGRL